MKRSLRSWLWRVPIEQEVDEELALHVEMRRREGRPLNQADIDEVRRACLAIARKRDREMRVVEWLGDRADDAVVVEEGSLYPALYRMERRGWLEAEWGESDLGRRAKLYRLTRQGRAQLAAETDAWRLFTTGVSKILLAQ